MFLYVLICIVIGYSPHAHTNLPYRFSVSHIGNSRFLCGEIKKIQSAESPRSIDRKINRGSGEQ